MTGSTHPARLEAAHQFVRHIGHADIDRAIELLSPEVTYSVLGKHALAGRFSGPEEVASHMIKFAAWTQGTFDPVKLEDWLVGEEHVAAVAKVAMRADGRGFTGRELLLLRFDIADKIAAINVFFEDQRSIELFVGPDRTPEEKER